MKVHCAILLAAVILLGSVAFADPYVYPVVMNSPEWNAMSPEERIEALQVPEEILADMTTEDVHLTFLALPTVWEYYYESGLHGISPQEKFNEFLLGRYNVVDTLLSRDDATSVVTAHYLTYLVDETIIHDCDYNENRSLTKLILCQYEIINELTPAEKKALVEKAYEVYVLDHAQENSCFMDVHKGGLIGRIMQVDEFQPFIERLAEDPDVARCNVGLWGNSTAFEYVPAYIDFVTSIDTDGGEMPKEIVLHSAFPNPFNPATTISFTLPDRMPVTLAVYNLAGQKVTTLMDGPVGAGAHEVVFDSTGLASGVYVYRLETAGFSGTGKMLLMK